MESFYPSTANGRPPLPKASITGIPPCPRTRSPSRGCHAQQVSASHLVCSVTSSKETGVHPLMQTDGTFGCGIDRSEVPIKQSRGRGVVKGTEVSLAFEMRELAERYGTNPKTVAKWQRHTSVYNAPRGPRDTILTRRKKR